MGCAHQKPRPIHPVPRVSQSAETATNHHSRPDISTEWAPSNHRTKTDLDDGWHTSDKVNPNIQPYDDSEI